MNIENNADGASSIGRVTKNTRTMNRHPLSEEEIQTIKRIAHPEWKGIILFALNTGQGLCDIARLRWKDIKENTVCFFREKTAQLAVVDIARPVAEYLASLPKAASSDAPLFPETYKVAMRDPTGADLQARFVAMQKKAKLKPWSFHKLRLTFVQGLTMRRHLGKPSRM